MADRSADHGDQLLAGVALEPRPVVVRLLGEPDVRRGVVAVPQDPARVVAGAAVVAELEALEPHHAQASPRELARGGGAEGTEAGDGDVVPVAHCTPPSCATRGSSQRRMSRLSSSMGANHPWR